MTADEPELPSCVPPSSSSPSQSHSNSYGYPSAPLVPVKVSEETPVTPDMLFSPEPVSHRLNVNNHASMHGEEHRGGLKKTPSSAESGHHSHKLQKRHAASSAQSVISSLNLTAVHMKQSKIDMNFDRGMSVNRDASDSLAAGVKQPDAPPSPPPKTNSSLNMRSQSEMRVGGGRTAEGVDSDRKGHEPAEPARRLERSEGARQNHLIEKRLGRSDIKGADVPAKPPTPPISPEDYSHSRLRRQGQKMERAPLPNVAEVISKRDHADSPIQPDGAHVPSVSAGS